MEIINKISVKKINWNKDLTDSRLEFNIQGKNINHTIANTLRRVGTTHVPIYAFTNVDISENTSIFNNNYIKLRLSNLPVLGIETDEKIFVKKDEKELEEDVDTNTLVLDDVDMSDVEKVNISTLKQLTMYLEAYNNTSNIITVGTDDCKFYYKEKQIRSPYSTNIPIIKLQPKQKIKLSAITRLGIEEDSTIFSPVSIFTFREKENNNYDIILESRGQLDEKKILDIIYSNVINLLDNFYKLIPDTPNLEGKMLLKNSTHTLGNLISEGLQKHTHVKFAWYNMPHPLDNTIIFHYELEKGNIKQICKDVIEYYKKIFNNLNKEIQKLS